VTLRASRFPRKSMHRSPESPNFRIDRVLGVEEFQLARDIESSRLECKWERKTESVDAGDHPS
jgi:hypothetical protein